MTLTPSATVAIARLCHEQNRLYCESIGDNSQVSWDDAPEWQRRSAIDGVLAIIEGKVKGPADSHRNWLEEKVRTGWSYGPTKDVGKKTHPCLVSFEALPTEQQAKDALFYHTAHTLLHAKGLLSSQVISLAARVEREHAAASGPAEPMPHAYPVREADMEDVARRFTYHPPRPDQLPRYNKIREECRKLAVVLLALVPPSRERGAAIGKLQHVMMLANAGIACNE